VFLGAAISGVVAIKQNPRIPVIPTYPVIYTAGYRFTGGTGSSNKDAFVVKLSEEPVIVNQP
jgi:hypothetical protein